MCIAYCHHARADEMGAAAAADTFGVLDLGGAGDCEVGLR